MINRVSTSVSFKRPGLPGPLGKRKAETLRKALPFDLNGVHFYHCLSACLPERKGVRSGNAQAIILTIAGLHS